MNRTTLIRLILLVFLPISASGNAQGQQANPLPRADTQVWNDIQIALPVNERFDLLLLGTLRIGRDVSHLVDERVGVGFSFKANKYFTLTPNYLYIGMQTPVNKKSYEHRLTIAATVRLPMGKFIISDRNQFERRIRHPQIDAIRYRNRLQIEHPLKLGSLKLQAFAGDEIFHDWSEHDWVRNRFSLGVTQRVNRHLTLDLYYMRPNDGRTRPGDIDVIGAVYRIRL
jgi:hypothetical protein